MFRILNHFPDIHEERGGLSAVNESVIIGEGEVHHGTRHNLSVTHHRAVHNIVHPQNGGLRRVQDGGAHHRAKHAPVRNGEGPACHVFHGDFTLFARIGQLY